MASVNERNYVSETDHHGGAFAIFTDTVSLISRPSKRVSETGSKFFPHFYLLDTIDVYVEHYQPKTFKKYSENRSKTKNNFIFMRHNASWTNELYGTRPNTNALGILGPSLCVDIVPQSDYASELVSNYLRLCIYVSERCDQIVTGFASEPSLIECSAISSALQMLPPTPNVNVNANFVRSKVSSGAQR
ncbi:13827_t:CDS:2 [Funneliformis mosseae]|uniref:13827_t:CDS:1 n=1 Tax=Funneliformis mosseae TaxID=27381 RepID=A0A9N9D3F4_FUNMO|nr:13827_t:CDS:2 [Funneliformis mosseae]